jgi:hypothetical protein
MPVLLSDSPVLNTLSASFVSYLKGLPTQIRLPRLEIMPYDPIVIERWHGEGLPRSVNTPYELYDYFHMDSLEFYPLLPNLEGVGCRGKIADATLFRSASQALYDKEYVKKLFDGYEKSLSRTSLKDAIFWIPMHGFFWHPRDLMGIENHLTGFYDTPELMHEINQRLLEFSYGILDGIRARGLPSIICFSEDMAYRNGPMISKSMFTDFIEPYHHEMIAYARHLGIDCVIGVDCDGNVAEVATWFQELGFDCMSPMERQTGMDLQNIQAQVSSMSFMGGFDKRVMHQGSDAIEREFAALEILVKKGRFLPAVDHQTPPDVSLTNYHAYCEGLERMYSRLGVR